MSTPRPGSMDEVVALEATIRAGLPAATGRLADQAHDIMTGKFPATGTRLDALRDIAKRMKP